MYLKAFQNLGQALCKAIKLFKQQALKKLTFWGSQDTHNWYRRYLNDDYLNQFIQEEDDAEHSDNEPVAYPY